MSSHDYTGKLWTQLAEILEADADAQPPPSTPVDCSSQRAAESIRQATERDATLYQTYLHDFSDGRECS